MHISVTSNIDQVIRRMTDFPKSQLPYALARGLTKTAEEVAEMERHEMRDVFDRPTPYTMSSVYVRPATKAKLTAKVWLKDFGGKGTAATRFLAAQIKGGARKTKRFERALESVGALPSGYYIVPGEAAKLDAYGNIDRGQIVQLLSYFKAFPEAGYKANMTDKRKAALAKGKKGAMGVVYFVGRPGDRLPLGIWARYTLAHGSAIKPVFIFVRSAHYESRFDFYYVASKGAESRLEANLRASMAEALRTMR